MTQASLGGLIADCPLSPKRLQSGTGVDAMYPYYAGFSATFASHLIASLGLRSDARILDPWNGSGTTTYVASELGYKSIGLDLNPFAALLASAKTPLQRSKDWIYGIAKEIVNLARGLGEDGISVDNNDPLLAWMTRPSVKHFRRLFYAINEFFGSLATLFPYRQTASLFLVALVRCVRSRLKVSGNPTWHIPEATLSISVKELENDFIANIVNMTDVLKSKKLKKSLSATILISDARKLPISENAVDVVLSSPPYCTRIDYAVSTSLELAALGLSSEGTAFNQLRKNLMGTTAIREPSSPLIPSHWSCSVRHLLHEIETHPSYASSRYYYKNFFQYFSDAHVAMKEIKRVLRPGGLGFLVLQNSYFKDIHIPLAHLYSEIANELGFRSEVVASFPASGYFANINIGASRYNHKREYFESILCIQRSAN